MNAMGSFLGKDIYAEMFHFDGTILSGIKTPAPRWKKCVGSVSGGMGEALGHAFVEKAFSPEAKKRALEMIQDLKEAFNQDLKTLDWLDATTREAAIEKLGLLSEKIGYPDHWHRYDNLSISRGSYWGNAKAAAIFSSRRQLSKIGGKVDRTEWGMSPQTVNAYYDPNTNSINFPAAILQPPFFSESANDASNFGAIGMVIGHEMTHGFDTSGSKFNGYGAEEDWWSPSVRKLFDQKASCLENEYSKFEALPGLNVNGKLTITENIADNGGLKLSYAAFKLARAGKPPLPSVAGLNEDQQFFVSMAQMWCDKQTDEALREQVLTDPHSPARFRVIGTVTNDPDFARAFGCQIGTPMAPKDRCGIW